MIRLVAAVLVGFAVWTLCWLTANFVLGQVFADELAAFEAGLPLTSTSYLALCLAASVFCSLAAGRVARGIRHARGPAAPLLLGLLLLATGIAVQASAWSRMPLWYHLLFLALLVPMVHLGARSAR